jgi:hypothetical protein
MYILIIVGDMTWIVRNLKNMEDSIFNSKPAKHLNLDDSDLDVVDTMMRMEQILKFQI